MSRLDLPLPFACTTPQSKQEPRSELGKLQGPGENWQLPIKAFLHDAVQPVDCLATKPRQIQIQKSLTPLACTSPLTRYVQLLYTCTANTGICTGSRLIDSRCTANRQSFGKSGCILERRKHAQWSQWFKYIELDICGPVILHL